LDTSLRFQGWLDTRTLPFPGITDRTSDTVAELIGALPEALRWALVTEFQTEPDAEILDRLLDYLARLRLALRYGPLPHPQYQVLGAFVSLAGAPQPDALTMALPGLSVPSLRLQVATRTLRGEDARMSLEQIASGSTWRGLLCWISLMRGGSEPGII